MKAFAAVFAREVFARWIVFPVALVVGLVPIFGSLSYGWSKPDAAAGRILIALLTATTFSVAFALVFGGSVIAGETSEKRISFFFSRPISAVGIWGGKLLAVLVLTFVPAALALVPAFVTSTSAARQDVFRLGGSPGAVVALFLVTLFVILAAHAVVTVVRLRSPWVVLDLLLTPALVLLAAAFLRSLILDSAFGDFETASPATAAILVLAAAPFLGLLVASLVQVAEGRTDARRAHGAFSVVFFGIVGTAVALVGAYAGWCASATATDLARIVEGAQTAPRGPWVAAGGPLQAARGAGSFLFDAAGGRSLRLRGYTVAFSQDGARAAWGSPRFGFFTRKDNGLDVLVADLAAGRAVATGLEAQGWSPLALSPSGRRLAIREARTLAAYDVSEPANPKQLAAFPLEDDGRVFAFVDEDTLRIFPRLLGSANRRGVGPGSLEITELTLSSKKSLVTGRFEREAIPFLRLSADGRTLVGVREKRLTLHDGKTGAVLATLAEGLESAQVRFLTGGRVAVAGVAGEKAQMKIFLESEEGRGATAVHTINLGAARRLVLGGEIAPGRVAVALLPFEENSSVAPSAAKLALVDASTGAVSPLGDGLVPADRFAWWWSAVLPPAEAGTVASTLFLDSSGRLVRLDATTGRQTVLLGRSK